MKEREKEIEIGIGPDLGTCTVRVCVSVTTLGTWTSIVRSSYVITGTCSSNKSDISGSSGSVSDISNSGGIIKIKSSR